MEGLRESRSASVFRLRFIGREDHYMGYVVSLNPSSDWAFLNLVHYVYFLGLVVIHLYQILIWEQRYELLRTPDGTSDSQHILLKPIPFSDEPTGLTETAASLVNADQYTSFLANKDGVSSLYLAVETGDASLVHAMLNNLGNNVRGHTSEPATQYLQLEDRKLLVQAALKSKNSDVLDVILKKDPSLVNERDKAGRTCLSIAASVGFHEGLCMLLDKSSSSILDWDDDGSCPIHMAVEKGHVNIFNELVKRFPDSLEQLNKKDVDGNTPVHLATINWRARTLYKLNSINPITKILNLQNADGLRPLDIAQNNLHPQYVFRERMTLMVLLNVCHPKGISWLPATGMTLRSRSEKEVGGGKYKDIVQVLLVVAALIATMTFAAGFTIPGGFNSFDREANNTDPKPDMFIISDTVAMYSSILAIVALIWAQLGDQELTENAFYLALYLLNGALVFMSWAFYFGVNATVHPNMVLQWTLVAVFWIFFSAIMVLFTPYVVKLHTVFPIFYKRLPGLCLAALLNFVRR